MQKLFKKVIQRSNCRWVVGLSVAALFVCASFGQVSTGKVENKIPSSKPSQDRANLARVQAGVLSMPLAFEVNRGQTDAKVKFLTRAQNFTVFLMPGETVLRGRDADVLRIKLRNANQSPQVLGERLDPRVTNYYIGNDRSKWLTGVPNFGQVRYRDVYSGIDMVYHSDQSQLEYDFVVKPGADPNQIGVVFEGASKIAITELGELELKSPAGDSVNHKPVVYQTIAGRRKLVDGEFALANNVVGFKIGAYDRTQPLVIDPSLQVLSFFGGTLNDEASGIAASAVQVNPPTTAGVVFVGRSQSPSLPGPGLPPLKPAGAINWDSFATGLNGYTVGVPGAAGTAILWTTYFGGSNDDAARGVAMDNQGNVYVSGYTNSSNFPFGTAASYDAYIVKLGAAGGGATAGTLYGGPFVDQGTSIALDYSTFSTLANAIAITNPATDPQVTPNVVIGGLTSGGIGQAGSPLATTKTPDGSQGTFSTCTATGASAAGCGTTDGFVAIFSPALALLHATYIGGGGNDQVNGVAVDVWGNIYATGFATPAVAPNFTVKNGIAQTTLRANWDASLGPLTSAVPFVAKWACTTGSPAIGVPSPPFGVTTSAPTFPGSTFPICGGTNNLKTLSNSALFGGAAEGNTFVNPQQTALGLPGITEAGLGIAVDQNGWGQEGVAGVADGTSSPLPASTGFTNAAGFPDIVPFADFSAVSTSNSPTTGGFEPGLSGPHVYVVGNTASRGFVNSLVFNASCTLVPSVSGPTFVPALCPVPYVFGGAVVATGSLPGLSPPASNPWCDLVGQGASACPTGALTDDLRIKHVANGTNSGQTQGWLAAFQFPAVTQVVVTPPLSSTTTVTTLNPPTIPNYIVLQPATCPATGGGAAACIQGAGTQNTAVFSGATPPTANFGCTGGASNPCPTAFIGSWNAVTVDSDEQVYVIGQIGMSGQTPALFGTGAPNRLALELERIGPYANTNNASPGGAAFPDPCNGPANAPCAFPEELFPTSAQFGSDFIVDSAVPGTGSSYGQLLPGSPPSPNPNQPGGLGNGIAVNPLREAFFVGTSTVLTPPVVVGTQATAGTVTIVGGNITTIAVALPGSGYLTAPSCTITGGSGAGATCTTTIAAGAVTAINVTNGGTGYTNTGLIVTLGPPPQPNTSLSYLTPSPIIPSVLPTPPTQGNLGGSTAQNAGESCPAPPCAGNGPEDVLYGAIQFYDAIASPTVVNFTATVNSFSSVTGPNGTSNTATSNNARAVVTYTNWEGQVLNIPPGCTITPNVPPGPGGVPAFLVTQIGSTAVFNVQVATAPTILGPVAFPGVVTSLVVFTKNGPCTGVGQPALDSWDPLTLTLSVSAPMSLSPENTFVITSKLASGIVDQYFAEGLQLVANQLVGTGIDVTTANALGPINFTVQIVPGQNWAGAAVTGSITVPTPTDIIYEAPGPAAGSTRIPVTINTLNLAELPIGTYTAFIMFTASPETPVLPTSGSTACSAATVPIASGTTSAACIPISITITPNVVSNIPAAIVFGSSTTPQQTSVVVANPTSTAYVFIGAYQPTPVFGTALPAANFSFVGTLTGCPSAVGATVAGTVAPGGLCSLPIQINPAGLPTGVYSGQILLTNNGLATGATPQTTVPLIVYVGPHTGEDTPSGNGLGLMLPANVPPVGTGGSQGAAPGSPGSYPLTLSVPSGVSPSGFNGIPNPTLIQVTGLNNTFPTAFSVGAPSSSGLVGVSFTNVGNGFGGAVSGCSSTYGSLASLPGSPLGPPCVWSLWVDATSLNSTNTTAMAACGGGFGETGTISFAPGGFPGSTLVVPLTVCVTDFPSLTLAMPNTFPNPTFGPTTGTGFGGCNGGNPDCLLAQPSNLIPGFPLSITDMVLATSGGGTIGSTAAPINLLAQAGNSSEVCKVLDIRTNGGVVNDVTIAPFSVQWVTLQQAPAVFDGPSVGAPNSLPFNSGTPNNIFSLCALLSSIPGCLTTGNPSFAAGPFTANPGMQTFQLCVDTDPVGNATGTFSTTVTINGAGVGSITVPINMIISQGGTTPPPSPNLFSQIGIFRPPVPVGGALGFFTVNQSGTYTFVGPPGDITTQFGLAGDIPVAGDWDGSGVIKLGVFRCPAPGAGVCSWYLDQNNNGVWDGTIGGDIIFQFGLPGDIPVVGDWNGNGISKVGVMRCPTGPGVCQWILDIANVRSPNSATFLIDSYGLAGDQPAVGNWTNSGGSHPVDQVGVMRGAGQWILNSSGSGSWSPSDTQYSYGQAGDVPVTGNWEGAANKRIGVFRCPAGAPGSGVCQWILNTSGSGAFSSTDLITSYGLVGDKPVVGFWTLP